MEAIETIKYRGCDIEIFPDECCQEDPNDWDDDYMFLIYDHRDFSTAPRGMDSRDAQTIFEHYMEGHTTYLIDKIRYWIIPVYAYIHGGVSLYISRRDANRYEPTGFDTSFKGFALVNKNEPKFWSFDDALNAAEELLVIWNQYLSGEVYGYSSQYGSCWGFYGDEGIAQAIEEAKAEIDAALARKNKERFERLKKYIKSKVPIQYRKLELVM